MAEQKKKVGRLAFLDWARGLAAFIMLQGHTFHAFTKTDLRKEGPYLLSQFVGGIPPAIFLFITGITLAFLMDSRARQGADGKARVLATLRRSGFLFLIAFLFRMQLWLFGLPYSQWADLLKVDILNCMGIAIALLAPMAVFTTFERIRLCAVLGLVIAALSPLVTMLDGQQLPSVVRMYFIPTSSYFSFFPWASFVAFGLCAGSILRGAKTEALSRIMQWSALGGVLLIIGGQYFSNLPYSIYTKSDFWIDSPGLTIIKLGIILVILAFAYLWTHYALGERWSLFRQFGTTSLLVYWVHIELVYGRWFGFWKESLTVPQVVLFAAILTILMILLSIGKSRWNSLRGFFRTMPTRISDTRSAS